MGCLPFSACLTSESRRSIGFLLISASFESLTYEISCLLFNTCFKVPIEFLGIPQQDMISDFKVFIRSVLPGAPNTSFPYIRSSGVICTILFLICMWLLYVLMGIRRIDVLHCMTFSTCILPNVVLRNLMYQVFTFSPKYDLLVFKVYPSF